MRRILVAGIGNVFHSDDGFGVAVAQRLERDVLPEGTRVVDFGIRGVHLAYDLLEPPDLLVIVDTTSRSGPPGTLYLIDPEVEPELFANASPDAHSMDPCAVLLAVRQMGGTLPRTRIVGCEPVDLDEGMGLSQPVEQAIEPAIAMIRRLIDSEVPS
ncbi:MAG: Hydrogenase maturation protease [Myxococcaceae bacterium]|nr:Hydrogenase maturation protease [Myxococcaceae bacterium]